MMVPILTDRPNTRLWAQFRRRWRAPLGSCRIRNAQAATPLTRMKGETQLTNKNRLYVAATIIIARAAHSRSSSAPSGLDRSAHFERGSSRGDFLLDTD